MIYKDKYLIFTIFEIIASYIENFDNNQKLITVGFVLSFYRNQFPKKEAIKCCWLILVLVTILFGLIPKNYWLSISPIV